MKYKLLVVLVVFAAVWAGCSQTNTPAPTQPNGDVISKPEIPPVQQLETELLAEVGSDRAFVSASASILLIDGPTTITQPGVYRVSSDFSATGDGTVITSGNVILFLGEHTITGPGSKLGRGIVVENAGNVHICGGRLKDFGIGVAAMDMTSSSIRGVRVAGADDLADPPNGIAPQIGTMFVNSSNNRLFWNHFDRVNLGIFIRGPQSYRNEISANWVIGGENGLLAICYNPAPSGGPEGPTNDVIRHNYLTRYNIGVQFSLGSANNLVRLNIIGYFVSPWEDFNGNNEFARNYTTQL